jgi:hypothetical protein
MLTPSTPRDPARSPRRDRILREAQPRVRVGVLDARRAQVDIVVMLLAASLLALVTAVLRLS